MEKRSRNIFFERERCPTLHCESRTGSTMWGAEHWISSVQACTSKISARTPLARPWSNAISPSETLDQQCLISWIFLLKAFVTQAYSDKNRLNGFFGGCWRYHTFHLAPWLAKDRPTSPINPTLLVDYVYVLWTTQRPMQHHFVLNSVRTRWSRICIGTYNKLYISKWMY